SVVAFAGGYRWPEQVGADPNPGFGEVFHSDPEIFRQHHPDTWAHRNADRIRGKVAIQMYIGTEDPGLAASRRLHAILIGPKLPHGYQEREGVAHNLKILATKVEAENFAFAVTAFGKRAH